MLSKSALNAACLTFLPVFIVFSAYFFLSGAFLYSLLALFGIVACMETRVRMGYRGQRSWLFAIHLACSCVLVLLLIFFLLQAISITSRLIAMAEAAFIGMLATGIVLVKNSRKRLY